MHFDRFDICEAYCVMERYWHQDGWLQERPSNRRRREATSIQLRRIQFVPAPGLEYETLTENGREIYDSLVSRYRLENHGAECDCFDCVTNQELPHSIPDEYNEP